MTQVWSCLMSQAFNIAIWGPRERQLLSMFVEHAGNIIDPCDSNFLGSPLTDWFDDYPVQDQ